MTEHIALIQWTRSGPDFLNGRYSREHTWSFDGGVIIPASPSPSVVPTPWSNPAGVDPEEAFVAAIASCHMLTFLWLASKQGWIAESYADRAVGAMNFNEHRVAWVSSVVLTPTIVWSGASQPSESEIKALHHAAHEQCFIANSVKTHIRVAAADSQ